jgi:hypothetical protein
VSNRIQTKSSLQATNKRRAWDLPRFVKTAAFYGVFNPKLPFLNAAKEPKITSPKTVLWSLNSSSSLQWGPLDDVVMGGVSKSDLNTNEKFSGKWTGLVTSENNGGFVGIRTKLFDPALDVSSCQGIEVKVKGDGQRYKFIARDDDDWNGVAWSYSFDTEKDKIKAIRIPFSKLIPTRFARTVPNLSFNSRTLRAIQFSLSKFEYDGKLNNKFREGRFNFELIEISLY